MKKRKKIKKKIRKIIKKKVKNKIKKIKKSLKNKKGRAKIIKLKDAKRLKKRIAKAEREKLVQLEEAGRLREQRAKEEQEEKERLDRIYKERIEIQIRTKQMHDFAERGIASHWIYKSSEKITHLAHKEYDWLRDLVEIMEKETNTEHSLEYTKLQMFQDYVFCFTPKGEIIKLPRGATPIDFAYAVHTKVGDSINYVKLMEEVLLFKAH